jgi:hypothetical protein
VHVIAHMLAFVLEPHAWFFLWLLAWLAELQAACAASNLCLVWGKENGCFRLTG